jgi:hypothetical protein
MPDVTSPAAHSAGSTQAGRPGATSEELPPALASMLDAHVAFELERWRSAAVVDDSSGVHEAVQWLRPLPLGAVLSLDTVHAALAQVLDAAPARSHEQAPATREGAAHVVRGVAAAVHAELRTRQEPVADLVPRALFDATVRLATDLDQVRDEILDQVTGSEVYSRLMSHVVYHGVKRWVLTENPVARKVPGASSLVRLGQRGLSAAAPSLERGIDAQLVAFVSATIADTIRDSRTFLVGMVDDGVVDVAAQEVWRTNSATPVAAVAALVSDEQREQMVDVLLTGWGHVRTSAGTRALLADLLDAMWPQVADVPVGDLLDASGLDEDATVRLVSGLFGPTLQLLADNGEAGAWLDARLRPFYRSWAAEMAAGVAPGVASSVPVA